MAGGIALSLASAAATAEVTEPITLGESSRFEVAVAGRVQLPAQDDDRANPPPPVGPTIDPGITTTTQRQAPSTAAVQFVVNNARAGERGQAALSRISYPWEEVLEGWTIVFEGPRPDRSGWIDFRTRHITIYVRESHSNGQLAHVVAHEVGHAVDFHRVTPDERDRWIEARGLGDLSWYPDATSNDFSSPAGDFAESFAVWQVGGNYQANLGGNPTAAQIALLEEITAD